MRKFSIPLLIITSFGLMGGFINGLMSSPILFAGKLAAPGTSVCSTTFPAYDTLRITVAITGYAGGETASLQFNGDTGNNYRYRWLDVPAGSTSFSAGLVVATTDRIKIGSANTTRPRLSMVTVWNHTATTEKTLDMRGLFATGAINTQSTIDLGNGAWFAASAATQITSVCLVTTGGSNMLAGSGFVVEAINTFF